MNEKILRLAIPFIVSNLTVPLLSSVDTALMGRLAGSEHLGAVGLGSSIVNFLYWNFAFLRMALAGLTAQALGSGNTEEMFAHLHRSLLLASLGSVVLVLFRAPLSAAAFALVDGGAEVEAYAEVYFNIRILAAPAAIGTYALTGWFIGVQNAIVPMVIAIAVNIINIGANFLFVVVFGMKSDGVALGTVAAQYSGFAIALGVMLLKHRARFLKIDVHRVFGTERFRGFFSVNRDIFIRTLSVILVMTYYNFASAEQGTVVLGVNVIFLQMIFMFSFFVDGFANAAEAIVGRLIGEKNRRGYALAVRTLFFWGAGLGVVFSGIYFLAFDEIIALFTNDSAIADASRRYVGWIVALPLVSVAAFVWDGIYLGATATAYQRNATLAAAAVFFVCYFSLAPIIGNHALLSAQVLFFGLRGVLMTLLHKPAIRASFF